jgi:glycosyltransferase involved in cell wall biosynthesis
MKKISIITPVFDEEENVEACYLQVKDIFARDLPGYAYEHIFCDNNSRDRTPALLAAIAEGDQNVKVIFNARNFGPLASNFNGLRSASGDAAVVALPADLQDPPELIPEFVRHWEDGHDVVYGIRRVRQEPWLLRGIRSLFYRLVAAWTPFPVPRDAGEFQLIDRRVLEALILFQDHLPYIRGMIAYCGFRSVGVPYTWKARHRGVSKATAFSYVNQGINGLISFNQFPLRLCLVVGFGLSFLSLLFALVSLMDTVFGRWAVAPGFNALVVAQFFLSGVLLFAIGVLGEYVYAIYSLVRWRPLVIERGRLNFDSSLARETPIPSPPASCRH